jgi:hypothetical protein
MKKNTQKWRSLFFTALVLVISAVLPLNALALQGGPDAFGYRYIDSNSVGGPEYVWEDIEKTGTTYKGFDKPEADYPNSMGIPIDIGFNFNFYGKSYRGLYLASNGYLAFTSRTYRSYIYDGKGFPSPTGPNNIIAPFWGWNDTFS